MYAYKIKVCPYVTKILNIFAFLQICLFCFLTLGCYWDSARREKEKKRKKYFRICETFQTLI